MRNFYITLISGIILSVFFSGCDQKSHVGSGPVNEADDMIAYLNPDERSLFVIPDFTEEVLGMLDARPVDNGRYVISVMLDNDSNFDLEFMVVPVSDPYYYALTDDFLTVEDVMEDIINDAEDAVEEVIESAIEAMNCGEDPAALIEDVVEEANRVIEEAAREAEEALQHVNDGDTDEQVDETKERNRQNGEQAKQELGNDCEDNQTFDRLRDSLRFELDRHFYDSTRFGLGYKYPYGTLTLTLPPDPADSTNLVQVFANQHGRFKAYQNAECYKENSMVILPVGCQKDADGLYYRRVNEHHNICRKGDGLCLEKYQATAKVQYFSDSTCNVVTREEGRDFKFVCD